MPDDKDLQYLLLKIKSKYDSLPHACKKVADYLLASHEEAVFLNIKELAQRSHVSEGTITNFVRSMGYGSFQEFKICMARDASNKSVDEGSILYGEINLNDKVPVLVEKVFHNNIDAILKTLKMVDLHAIETVADWMVKAKRIDFYGQSISALAAMNTANRLLRIGVRTYVSEDPHMQLSSAVLLGAGDVAIGISNTGQSREVACALKTAKTAGAYTVCITSRDDSPVAQYADIRLLTSLDRREILEDLPSRIAQISLLDALYVCVVAKTKRKSLKNLRSTFQTLENKDF